jgi:hypothetical protein
VLLQDKVMPCQYLPLSQEVELEKRGGVFTLITEDKTFVRMQGMNIATWSEAAFQEFLQNNPTGRQLHYKSQ